MVCSIRTDVIIDNCMAVSLVKIINMLQATACSPSDKSVAVVVTSRQVRVPEDVAPGTTVARVRARDRDLGLNGAVQYAFSPLTEAQHGAVFGIKPDTGKIYVKAFGLDHEQSPVS